MIFAASRGFRAHEEAWRKGRLQQCKAISSIRFAWMQVGPEVARRHDRLFLGWRRWRPPVPVDPSSVSHQVDLSMTATIWRHRYRSAEWLCLSAWQGLWCSSRCLVLGHEVGARGEGKKRGRGRSAMAWETRRHAHHHAHSSCLDSG